MSNSAPTGTAASAAALASGAVAKLAVLLRWSLVSAVAVMLACLALQVVMRYVFGRTPSWTEELSILMFAWATLGGFALGVHEGFHVRLTLVLEWLPSRLRMLLERGTHGVTAALGAYLFWSGWRYVDATRGARSAAIEYPIELLHGLAPIAGALILIFALDHFIRPRAAALEPAETGAILP